MPTIPKSAEQIVEEFENGQIIGDELKRRGVYGDQDREVEVDWLHSSLASFLVYAAETSMPEVVLEYCPVNCGEAKCNAACEKYSLHNLALSDYHRSLLSLAESINKE